MLTVRPRRLLKVDVGEQLCDLESSPEAMACAHYVDSASAIAVSQTVNQPFLSHYLDDPEEDPLELGTCMC